MAENIVSLLTFILSSIRGPPPTLADLLKSQILRDKKYDSTILRQLSLSHLLDESFTSSFPWRDNNWVSFCNGVDHYDFKETIDLQSYVTLDCNSISGTIFSKKCQGFIISKRRGAESGKKCGSCGDLLRKIRKKHKSSQKNLLIPLSDVRSRSNSSNTTRIGHLPTAALIKRLRKSKRELYNLKKRFQRLQKRLLAQVERTVENEVALSSQKFLENAMDVVLKDPNCRESLMMELLKSEADKCLKNGSTSPDLKPTVDFIMEQFKHLKHRYAHFKLCDTLDIM